MDALIHKITQSPVATFLFLVTLATSLAAFQNQFLKEKFILRPYAFVHRKQYFTVITSGLIHGDWQHLIMNMLTFYIIAFPLEHTFGYLQVIRAKDDLAADTQTFFWIVGHAKFFLIYFISMVLADVTTILKYREIPSYGCLGASGALCGLMMSFVILGPALGGEIMFLGFIPGWLYAIIFIVYSYFASRTMMDNVAHEAHLWGAVAGIVFTVIFYPKESWMFVERLHHTFYGWIH